LPHGLRFLALSVRHLSNISNPHTFVNYFSKNLVWNSWEDPLKSLQNKGFKL
jgi:hypothetical protein